MCAGLPQAGHLHRCLWKGHSGKVGVKHQRGQDPPQTRPGCTWPARWGPTKPATVVFERLRSLISGPYSLKNKKLVSKQQSRHRLHRIRIGMPRAVS